MHFGGIGGARRREEGMPDHFERGLLFTQVQAYAVTDRVLIRLVAISELLIDDDDAGCLNPVRLQERAPSDGSSLGAAYTIQFVAALIRGHIVHAHRPWQ